MADFTKGPWKYEDRGQTVWGATPAGEIMVCQIRGWGHLTGTVGLKLSENEAAAIQDANGRLVSAAPELYEACKSLIATWDSYLTSPHAYPAYRQAKAALAKAEGTEAANG